MGHSTEGQEHQGVPGEGGGLHSHLQQGWPEGQMVLQGRGNLQGQTIQDWGSWGWKQGDDHPSTDRQEASVQEHGQIHSQSQRRWDRLLSWCWG